ncbi:MAG TPA: hypothetical protein V6D07_14770 [Trichocoleus sp.]
MPSPFTSKLKSTVKNFIRSVNQKRLLKSVAEGQGLSPSCWGMEYRSSELTFRDRSLSSLLARWGSPLHVIDEAKLIANLRAFQTIPSGFDKGLEVFYSYKTNPLPWVFEVLHRHGAGAEVISEYELWLALRLGVLPEQIIYNGPAKSQSSLEMAIERGLLSINANNLEEIDLLAALAAQKGKPANVGIRITTAAGWTGQFGLPVEDGSALEAFRRALTQPELKVTTLHCHRGKLIYGEKDLRDYLQFLLDFVDKLKTTLDWLPEILDVGGSLAVPTVRYLSEQEIKQATAFLVPPVPPNPQSVLTPERYSEIVVQTIRGHFEQRGYAQPRIVSEPGRSLTANSQFMLATVQNVKHDANLDFVVMDVGVNLASCVTSEYHEVLPLQVKREPLRCHRLVGPICHMGDTLYMARYLPQMARKDAIAIMDSGAYFIADATSFSFPQPAVVAITTTGEETLVRDAESFEHMVSLDRIAVKPSGEPCLS